MNHYDLTPDEAEVFFSEAWELLDSLDRDLIELEKDTDDEIIHRVFRALHTLKGAAGSVGHDGMAQLAHVAETLLDRVRNHEIDFSTQMADLLFQVLVQLRLSLEDVTEDRPAEANEDIASLGEQLTRMMTEETAGSDAPVPTHLPPVDAQGRAIVEDGLRGGLNLLVVFAEADPTSIAPMARLLQMFMHAEQIAQIIATTPTVEQLEQGEGNCSLVMITMTDLDRAELEAEMSNIFDISLLRVADLSNAAHLVLGETGATDGEERTDGAPASPPADEAFDAQARPIEAASQRGTALSSRTVRTSVERLDKLMNLAGELVTDRNRLFQLYEDFSESLNDEQLTIFNDVITHLSSVTDQIHDQVFKARMQPIEFVFNKFPRFVRQICQEVGKDVELVVTGQETEVDRTVIEQIGDPILHLVRNAIDHGIETTEERLAAGKDARGRLTLNARSEEGSIIVSITDDGRGVDADKVKNKAIRLGLIGQEQAQALTYQEALELIFAPGLSTAIKISDLSGRGVGMDVVRNNIQRLNGSVVAYSTPGAGTTFELRLPLTLAIIPTLLAEVRDQVFAVPLPNVLEIFKLNPESVQHVRGRETISLRGEVLPLVRLAELFDREIDAASQQSPDRSVTGNRKVNAGYVISLSYRDVRMGVIVSRLLGKQDVVIKALGYPISNVEGLTGATLLGDGRIGLIIDVAALVSIVTETRAHATNVLIA